MSWGHVTCQGSDLGDRHLEGVTLEMVGPVVPLADARASRWELWWELEELSVRIKIRRVIIRSTATPLYGVIWWRSNGQRKEWIAGHEHPHTRRDLLHVSQWIKAVLRKLPRAGRPEGTGDLDADELERAVRRAITTLLQECPRPSLREGRRRVKLALVAAILSNDKNLKLRTTNDERLRNRLRDQNLPTFSQMREEEMRRLGFK